MYKFSAIEAIAALLLGLPLFAGVFVTVRRTYGKKKKIVLIVIFVAIFSILAFLLLPPQKQGTEEIWLQRTPWKQIIMGGLMIFGIFAKAKVKALREQKARNQQREINGEPPIQVAIDKTEVQIALWLSWFTYGILYSQIGDGLITVSNVILSIQTGFVWQTLTEPLTRGIEKPQSKKAN